LGLRLAVEKDSQKSARVTTKTFIAPLCQWVNVLTQRQEDMPPALEPDFEQAEAICVDAGQHGSFTPQQSEWIEAFYKNVEDRMLNIYDGARLRAWRINSRQELAAFWQEQAGWFDQMLGRMQEARKKLRGFCVTEPAALRSLIETLSELVAACRGAQQLLA
jgi:hypothetical protein